MLNLWSRRLFTTFISILKADVGLHLSCHLLRGDKQGVVYCIINLSWPCFEQFWNTLSRIRRDELRWKRECLIVMVIANQALRSVFSTPLPKMQLQGSQVSFFCSRIRFCDRFWNPLCNSVQTNLATLKLRTLSRRHSKLIMIPISGSGLWQSMKIHASPCLKIRQYFSFLFFVLMHDVIDCQFHQCKQ